MKRLLTLRNTRRVAQVFFFCLFLFFVFVTDLRYLKGYPVSLFLQLDPLVAFATAITTHTVYMGLLWSLLLIVPTLLFGRIFCNWICPYGILHHFIGWLMGKRRAEERERIEANRYKKLYSLKYVILIAMIAAALGGSLQIGWLDPICLFHRSMSTVILPMINLFFPSSVYVRQYFHVGAWVIGFMLLFLVGMNVVIPRFFCRVLCPLGAFLGTLSTVSLWRIERDPDKCVDCDLCLKNCEGASDPHTQLAQERVLRLLQLHRGLPGGRAFVQIHASPQARSHRAGGAGPPRVSRRADRASAFTLLAAPPGRATATTTKKSSARPAHVEEKDFLGALHQVRPVHPRLPDECPAAGVDGVGPRRHLDADPQHENRLLRGELHPLRPGLPDRRDPAHHHRGKDRHRGVRRRRPHQARHRVFRSRPLPALGHGNPVRRLRGGLPRVAQGHLSRAKSPSPSATAIPSRCAGPMSTPRSASAAASANTNAPSTTRPPSA